MKITIQELIRGHVEQVDIRYAVDVIKELIDRRIPMTINYVDNFDTTDTNKERDCVNSKYYRL